MARKQPSVSQAELSARPGEADLSAHDKWLEGYNVDAIPGSRPADKIEESLEKIGSDIKVSKSDGAENLESHGAKAQKDEGAKVPRRKSFKSSKLQRLMGVKGRKKPGAGTKANPRKDQRSGRNKVSTSIHFVEELMVLINKDRAEQGLTLSDWLMLAAAEKLGLKTIPGGADGEADGDDEDDDAALEEAV